MTYPLPGSVGPYLVTGKLGQGESWQVIEGRHDQLGHVVALKIPRFDTELSPDWVMACVALLRDEGQRLATLTDRSHVITVRDFGFFEYRGVPNVPYLAMEVVEGGTLAEHLEQTGALLRPEIAVAIGTQTAAGVAAIHEAGLQHRDIKPDNVLVARRRSREWKYTAVVTDLSLSSLALPDYAAHTPEQWRQKDVGDCCRWTYAMIAGSQPPTEGPVRFPVAVRTRIARARHLEWILNAGLGRGAVRFANGRELEAAFRAYRAKRVPDRCPAGFRERVWLRALRNPALSGLALLLLVAVTAGAGAAWDQNQQKQLARAEIAKVGRQAEEDRQKFADLDRKILDILIRDAVQRTREFASDKRDSEPLNQARLSRRIALRNDVLRFKLELTERRGEPAADVASRICDAILAWADGQYYQVLREAAPEALATLPLDHPARGFLTYQLYRVRGAAYIDLSKFREAEAALAEAIRADPDGWGDLALRGVCLELLGRDEEAARALELAISKLRAAEASIKEPLLVPPVRTRLFGNAGWLVLQSGRPAAAVPLLREASAAYEGADKSPPAERAEVFIGLGMACGRTGNHQEAETFLTRGIALAEPLPAMKPGGTRGELLTDAYLARADAYTFLKMRAPAVRDLGAALSRPMQPPTLRGQVLVRLASARSTWVEAAQRAGHFRDLTAVGGGLATVVPGHLLTEATRDATDALGVLTGPSDRADRGGALTVRALARYYLDDWAGAESDIAAALVAFGDNPGAAPQVALLQTLKGRIRGRNGSPVGG